MFNINNDMPIQKIKSGRILTVDVENYVGDQGTIFYDQDIGLLRLSDGVTPGGIIIPSGENAMSYTKLLDQISSTILYIGDALPNSLESDPVWRLKRVTFDSLGNVEEVRYANGGKFDQIWDNRTTLTYV